MQGITHNTSRRVGVEIEFGGLTEDDAAGLVAERSGASVTREGAKRCVDHPDLGKLEFYLDTRFRDDALFRAADDIARLVTPVELVTQPVEARHIDTVDEVVNVLRAAGATGTRDGFLLGYGLHLNPEIREAEPAEVHATLLAFALLEPALRERAGMDITRRILPFTAPYPLTLVDRLAGERPDSLHALAKIYLSETRSRNHGLDMLPLFAHYCPEADDDAFSDEAVSARPAYHYRLPDCRIDDPDWSVGAEWRRWLAVEAVAADGTRLADLARDWRDHRASALQDEMQWRDRAMADLDAMEAVA